MSNKDQDDTLTPGDAKNLLRLMRKKQIYTSTEFVYFFFRYCTQRGWPTTSLSETLVELEAAEIIFARDWARECLAGWKPHWLGTRLYYATPHEGDYERMMQSPFMPREFIEALSDVGTNS